jgi:subtilisin family serine protease
MLACPIFAAGSTPKEAPMISKKTSFNISISLIPLTILLFFTFTGQTAPSAVDLTESVLIRTSKPYQPLVTRIEAAGGRVTQQYKYVDAIAAEVPRNALNGLRSDLVPGSISKDLIVPVPKSVDTAAARGLAQTGDDSRIAADDVQPIAVDNVTGSINPNAYLINNSIMNVTPLLLAGTTGAGVIVATIDSGIRPGFPHISGSVIGGEDFVGDGLGFSNSLNDGHGTFVAGMIAAHVAFIFSPASSIRNAVLAECPSCFADPPTNTIIPMVGTAPASRIYALRVFGPTGGAPTSRVLAAMERVIELREKFDTGMPGGVDIKVCNMSLDGPTLYAGRDLLNTEVNKMVNKDIVLSIAAGNAGPSSLTIGSPGTSIGAITVGAASQPHNERILRRLQFGPAIGSLYRPFLGSQTAYFSSRGPNADGRPDPDVMANGFASFGQGFNGTNTITIGSGTSFSTPSVSGVAALLRQKYPSATARQIRNAIIMSANPGILDDGSTELDQGAGYVDALAASTLLGNGNVPDSLAAALNSVKSVKANIERGAGLGVSNGNVAQHFSNLKPGQRFEILYNVTPNTSQVTINLSNVVPSLPPAQQNQLFGDDIVFAVHSAKTSAIGEGDYKYFNFTLGGTVVVNNPETGLMRITVSGDWTNAGNISGDLAIASTTDPVPQFTRQAKISDGDGFVIPINIPSGVRLVDFRLIWRDDWSNYPISDIDLFLIRPNGTVDFAGATLNDPEHATVNNPAAGQWLVIVDGFQIPAGSDKFELRVSLDGKVVR